MILTHSNPYEPTHNLADDRDTEAEVRRDDPRNENPPDPRHKALLRLLDFERWRWSQASQLADRLARTLDDNGDHDLAAIAQGIVAVLDSRQSEEPHPDLDGTVRSIEARMHGKAAHPFINLVSAVDAAVQDRPKGSGWVDATNPPPENGRLVVMWALSGGFTLGYRLNGRYVLKDDMQQEVLPSVWMAIPRLPTPPGLLTPPETA